ncbi:MAG: hypothetical protein LH605_11455 [Microbacteriaceae bacterium]|nr:hypothetical protein [Microbacteriaceae bacterium]
MSDSLPPARPPPADPRTASDTPGALGSGRAPGVDWVTRFFDGIHRDR